MERSFADSKEMHGLRYARFRGLNKVRGQCLLTAACQNMKKIALIMHRRESLFGPRDPNDPDSRLMHLIFLARQALQNGPWKWIFRQLANTQDKTELTYYCLVI